MKTFSFFCSNISITFFQILYISVYDNEGGHNNNYNKYNNNNSKVMDTWVWNKQMIKGR